MYIGTIHDTYHIQLNETLLHRGEQNTQFYLSTDYQKQYNRQ